MKFEFGRLSLRQGPCSHAGFRVPGEVNPSKNPSSRKRLRPSVIPGLSFSAEFSRPTGHPRHEHGDLCRWLFQSAAMNRLVAGITSLAAVFFLYADRVLAADPPCSDESVLLLKGELESIRKAGFDRLRSAKPKPGGGYDIPPTPAAETGQLNSVNAALSACAKGGSSLAAYVVGEETWRDADSWREFSVMLRRPEFRSSGGEVHAAAARVSANASYAEAIQYFRAAAAGGQPAAMYSLAEAYRDGKGVERSAFVAIEWFDKAARAATALGASREYAIRCLEQMTILGQQHPLTVRLSSELYGTGSR